MKCGMELPLGLHRRVVDKMGGRKYRLKVDIGVSKTLSFPPPISNFEPFKDRSYPYPTG